MKKFPLKKTEITHVGFADFSKVVDTAEMLYHISKDCREIKRVVIDFENDCVIIFDEKDV